MYDNHNLTLSHCHENFNNNPECVFQNTTCTVLGDSTTLEHNDNEVNWIFQITYQITAAIILSSC